MSRARYRRFWGRQPVQEVDAELGFHFQMRVEELTARGVPEAEARRAVLARLGDIELARGQCIEIGQRQRRREALVRMFETLGQDIRLVMRTFARQKAWTLLAVITLGIGIGATSSLFTIVNAVLVKRLPFPDSDRIMSMSIMSDGFDANVVDEPSYVAWRGAARSFSSLAAYGGASTVMNGAAGPEIVSGRRVAHGYFDIFAVPPRLGRTFVADEDRIGSPRVVILSEQIWRRHFSADTGIVNRTVLLDENPATVVGVMPASFTTQAGAQYWVPYRMRPASPGGATFFTSVVGRLAPGTTPEAAQAELQSISRIANASRSADWRKGVPVVMSLHERRFGDTRSTLLMLFGAVGVLLLIACANVSNLLLARAARRQREFAVRVAIGASSWRIVRWVLCESVLLAGMGAAVGLAIAALAIGSFLRISPPTIANLEGVTIDWAVVAFTTAVALVTGIVFGLIPALQVRRTDVNSVLGNGATRSTASTGQARLRRALVIAELATALVLVTAAGLLTRSFARVTSIDPGLEPDRVLVSTVQLSYSRYTGDKRAQFYDRLVQRLASLPGVEAVSLVDARPLGGPRMTRPVTIDGRKGPRITLVGVDAAYFRTTGAQIVAGRGFTPEDRAGEPTAVINQTMVEQAFGGRLPIGERHHLDDPSQPPSLIVGVARDVLQHGVERGSVPIAYLPLRTGDISNYMHVLVRGDEPSRFVPPMRAIIRQIDPLQPSPEFNTVEQIMSEAVAPRRFTFVLLGAFALIGGALAAIGLYGVMSYVVAERTKEIGVRVALGANGGRVMRLVVGQGMLLTLVGTIIGLAASLAAVRLLKAMLFQVSIYDPWAFAGASLVLVVTGVVACAVPAWRAARLDPVNALRSD